MAIDQREALIAAVRAQVEKEKAAKAEKLKKEQETMMLSGKKPDTSATDADKPKHKALSAEDIAKIEEKKRRKRAAEMGIELEETTQAEETVAEETSEAAEVKEEPKAEKPKKEVPKKEEPKKEESSEGLGMSVGIQADKSGKSLSDPVKANVAAENTSGGLGGSLGGGLSGGSKSSSGGLGLNIDVGDKKEEPKKPEEQKKAMEIKKPAGFGKAAQPEKSAAAKPAAESKKSFAEKPYDERERLRPTKLEGGTDSVKVIEDDVDTEESISFAKDGSTTIISDGAGWQQTETDENKKGDKDDIINIVPNRAAPSSDIKSVYDLDDDDDSLGAEISKLGNFDDGSKKMSSERKVEEAEKKKAEAEAKKKADIEEARKKAMSAEAKKRAEQEQMKREAEAEAARKKEEERRKKLAEAERLANERERRIAEAEAKRRAAEAEKRRAEEAEAKRIKKAAEEEKRRLLAEERQKAAEEARRKAEEEARAKAKEEALKKAEAAKKKAAEAAKILEEARKAEEEAAKQAEENKKRAEEEAKRKAEEEAKRKADEEAKRKAEEEAKRKAEEEAKKAAEEARRKAEEARRILEEAKKAEEEALKRAEEAKKKAEEEAKKKAEEEAKKKAEEALKKATEEAARKKAEEARRKAEEEAKRKAEEARKILEEAKAAEEAALKAAEEADSIKIDLTKPSEDGKLPLAAYYLEKYTKVESISGSLIATFNDIAQNRDNSRNVVLLGEHGFGLTTMGEDFARSFYDMGICKEKTIAKIKAQALNKVNLAGAMSKLKGGCMVVENAGLITIDRLNELMKLTAVDNSDVIVVLTGEEGSINRLFDNAKDAAGQFTHQIKVSGLGNGDMLAIAKAYISQRGYKPEDSVDGTIRNLLMAMESGNIDRMLKAIDDAMLKCEEREKSKGKEGKKYLLSEDFK